MKQKPLSNAQRMRHLRTACGFRTNTEFETLCARSRRTVHSYISGEAWPPSDVLTRIRGHLEAAGAPYDAEWLIPSEVPV